MWNNPLELRDDLKKDEDRDPFGRVPPKPKPEPEPELTNLGDASKLNRQVGEQGKNDRRDVAKVETMLGRTGALDLKKTDGPTGYWGERTREATRAFQKQNGLKVDGQINPGGETIRTLAKVAGGLIKTLAGNTAEKAQPAMQPAPRVTDTPVRHPDISTRHPGADRDRGLQTAAWPTHPSPSHLLSSPPYALTDDVVSENQRMARALAKRRGIGDFDRFTTDAINTDGAKAVYEIGDLIKQVRANDPAQVDELLEKTRQGIAPANVRLLARIAAADVDGGALSSALAQRPPERSLNLEKDDHIEEPLSGVSTNRRQSILSQKEEMFEVDENEHADADAPWYEFQLFSPVSEHREDIEKAAEKYGVDPDLARAIMYMETTHGYYDAPLDLAGINKSIRPMNVNVDFWKGLGITRDDLDEPGKNIDAGVRILSEIVDRVPDGSIRKIATLYNNLGAKSVSDYGARVEQILKDRLWEKQ